MASGTASPFRTVSTISIPLIPEGSDQRSQRLSRTGLMLLIPLQIRASICSLHPAQTRQRHGCPLHAPDVTLAPCPLRTWSSRTRELTSLLCLARVPRKLSRRPAIQGKLTGTSWASLSTVLSGMRCAPGRTASPMCCRTSPAATLGSMPFTATNMWRR